MKFVLKLILATVIIPCLLLGTTSSTGAAAFAESSIQGAIYSRQNAAEFLIITSPALETQANELADYRNSMGISTEVKTTDWIYTHYSGRDNPEKIRNYIKTVSGLEYVLIFGDEDQVPVRYAYIYADGYDDVPTDLYYADLQYTWDDNGDELWGDLRYDTVNGIPDLCIGRLPASNASEAQVLVNKIKTYEQNTSINDAWFKKVLLIGTKTFGEYEGEILKDYIDDNYIPSDYTVTKLYESDSSLSWWTGDGQISEQINGGCGIVNFAGHGGLGWDFSYGWAPGDGTSIPWWTYGAADAYGLTNGSKLPVIFSAACQPSRFDGDSECIGEAFVLNPNGGAIAYFGATREAIGCEGEDPDTGITSGLAGELDWRFSEKFFSGERVAGKVWCEAIKEYIDTNGITYYDEGNGVEGYLDWWTVAEYGSPFMDPTLMIGGMGIETTINTSNLVSSHQATIHYVEGGVAKTDTTYGVWSGTPDYSSTLSIDNIITVSSTERYYTTDTTSWTVTEPTAHSVAYYHQFKPTISVSTNVGASLTSTNYVTLSYSYNGSSATFALWDGHSFNDWIDAGSTATLFDTSSGSTPTHCWDLTLLHGTGATSRSWVINDASARGGIYYEQFKPVISVTTIGQTNLDTTNYVTLTYHSGIWELNFNLYEGHSFNDWINAGTTASLSATSSGSNDTHRWHCPEAPSWTINDASTRTAAYYEQFLVTVTTIGLSSSHPTTINVMQCGVTNHPTTYTSWSNWADSGSTLSIDNLIVVSSTERYYTTDTTSWTVNSALTSTVNYFHQFLANISTAGLDPSHPATITFMQYGVINNSTTSATWGDWADAGSALSISVESGEWSTTDTTSWTVDSPISATVNYQQVIPSSAQGGLSGGAIAGIVVGSCAAVVGIYFAVRKRVWKG